MAPRRKKQTLTVIKGEDGKWRVPGPGEKGEAGSYVGGVGGESPFLPQSRAEIRTLQKFLNLREPPAGLDIRPTLGARLSVYEHPPVPGSVGHWTGDGSRKKPYRWVGVSEKVVLGLLGAALVVWGLECIEIDISNWWASSALNVGNDLSKLDDDVLDALGIPHSTNSVGAKSVGARQAGTFFSWLFKQVVVQGGDLEQAATTIGGLSTGFPSGGGTSVPPPGGTPGIQGPP